MTIVTPFGREAIEEILPHREPFLLIDEVLELGPAREPSRVRRCAPTSGTSPVTSPAGR